MNTNDHLEHQINNAFLGRLYTREIDVCRDIDVGETNAEIQYLSIS